MTPSDTDALAALEQLLDLTDELDWHLIHNTVHEDVKDGKISVNCARTYHQIVDRKLAERGLTQKGV